MHYDDNITPKCISRFVISALSLFSSLPPADIWRLKSNHDDALERYTWLCLLWVSTSFLSKGRVGGYINALLPPPKQLLLEWTEVLRQFSISCPEMFISLKFILIILVHADPEKTFVFWYRFWLVLVTCCMHSSQLVFVPWFCSTVFFVRFQEFNQFADDTNIHFGRISALTSHDAKNYLIRPHDFEKAFQRWWLQHFLVAVTIRDDCRLPMFLYWSSRVQFWCSPVP